MDAREASHLVLDWHDRQLTLDESRCAALGTDPDADLAVVGHSASRRHAHIEHRKQYFVLVDHSTNGTYVQTEDEKVTFLRRGELRLWGNGWIALGEPLSAETAIRFRHT
ncbi:MAG TPA: FHA domain-containing protein [Pseudomonadales bacterium]